MQLPAPLPLLAPAYLERFAQVLEGGFRFDIGREQ